MNKSQLELSNRTVKDYTFLNDMSKDSYFPPFLVEKARDILIKLCKNIEDENPKTTEELYVLTHAATDKINDLQEEFYEHDSEIETAARDNIGMDFHFISNSYGFENADVEELIAPRDW